jgi:hypothetical protein
MGLPREVTAVHFAASLAQQTLRQPGAKLQQQKMDVLVVLFV